MIAAGDRISVGRDMRANRIADEVAVKSDWPGRCEQQHLVVAGALASELPAEGFLQVAENAANDC